MSVSELDGDALIKHGDYSQFISKPDCVVAQQDESAHKRNGLLTRNLLMLFY